MFKPRPRQAEVLKYTRGKMGVSAVPGSGKTQTLSCLAANLITSGCINDEQEILIVTLVNSAVNNFSARIAGFMREHGLLPNLGYRVLTLHGLANQIVRERPDLVGLDNNFQIIDEREANQILASAVQSWMSRNQDFLINWSNVNFQPGDRRFNSAWQDAIITIARNFIRQSKDLQCTPAMIQDKIRRLNAQDPLLQLGADIYHDYQRALSYRSAVDFDDLIRFALSTLRSDRSYLERLRYRWPYILEDEAQDSSLVQEQILQLLAGEEGNWVRVGDPNQAIYETFTTASPEFLKNFLRRPDVTPKTLPNSGRSTKSIVALANELIRWSNRAHPVPELRTALSEPLIQPAPPGDPQPNPPDNPQGIWLYDKKHSAGKELETVSASLKRWLAENPDQTVAVLVPRNDRGAKLVEILEKEKIPYLEVLQTSQSTRETARILAEILEFIEDPAQTNHVIRVFLSFDKIFLRLDKARRIEMERLIRTCGRFEDFLYPKPGNDWLDQVFAQLPEMAEELIPGLELFREYLTRWQKAADLPIHQLVITIGQDLFTEQSELALTHKLALLLEQAARNHAEWQLPDFVAELKLISENKRKLFGFTEEETGFNPDLHKGKVIVTTYHKAKGLEWDRVYLTSVNNYDFPSAQKSDDSISEKYFYREPVNLEAEALAKLKALVREDPAQIHLEYGPATEAARIEYAAERLRLLFVGITRAKKELIVTWNTGDSHRASSTPKSASIPFIALKSYLEEKQS